MFIIPLYKDAALAEALCNSLKAVGDEQAAETCSVFAVNDSPDDTASANAGLRRAAARHHDALLLNSDTIEFPGAITETWLASSLRPFGIHPHNLRFGDRRAKGYDLPAFAHPFARFLNGELPKA
jgi:hypothetical protein